MGGVRLDPMPVLELVPGRAQLADELPARSVSAYSTYLREHHEPGVVGEPIADDALSQLVETEPLSR